MTTAPIQLRTVYTVEQFAAEIMGGNVSPRWVANQCRQGKIKTVSFRPTLIPVSSAAKFVGLQVPQTAAK